MKNLLHKIPIKIELFAPILLVVLISIFGLTLIIVNKSKENINQSIERMLVLEVNSIVKMLEREKALKLENAINDLKVMNHLFYASNPEFNKKKQKSEAINQFNEQFHQTEINDWQLNGKHLSENHDFVDLIKKLTGSTATIFQRFDSGFIRISTNVLNSDSNRANFTYLPYWSPVVKEVLKGKTYLGRAYVVNDWYITAYEPIYSQDSIIGMLYVGKREKDLDELRKILKEIRIGKSGYPFVFDKNANMIIHPDAEDQNWRNEFFVKQIMKNNEGVLYIPESDINAKRIMAYTYFPDFEFYIAAFVNENEENQPVIRKIILFAGLTGFVVVLLISLFMYSLTRKRIHNYLSRLEESDKRYQKVSVALQESEKQFRTLFNNTSDDIFVIDFEGKFLEVNNSACRNLGYSREELLRKRFSDIKTPAFVNTVRTNLDIIKENGSHQYESEHLTFDGRIIPVEMKSRKIEFRGKEVILTAARDISERKKVEQKIISTIIETEEKERKRFAADLHDVLAPILTTIKLFTDLLKKGDNKKISNEEVIKNIDELVDQAIVTAKEISNNIRPNVLQDFGLATAISDFCNYVNKTRSVKINLFTTNYSITKRGIEETILYQAVKELINNTLKHAKATTITIDLKSFKDQILLYYRDDGVGFNYEKAVKEKTGLGLNNVLNKIKTIKGSIDLNSSSGNGMFMLINVRLSDEN